MAPKKSNKAEKDDKKSKNKNKQKPEGKTESQLLLEGLWKTRLRETEINDDDWKCSVAMLVEEKTESCEIIELYRAAAKDGSRPVVKNIDKSDVTALIPTKRRTTKSPSPEKNKKKDKKDKKDKKNKKKAEGNQNGTIDDDIDQLIDASASVMRDSIDGTLPTDLLSLIVKCLILRLKNEDVLRREIILQEEQARISTALGSPEEKDKSDKEGKKGKGKEKKAQGKDDKRKSKSEKNAGSTDDSSPKKEKNQEGRKSKNKGKKEKEQEIIEDQPLDGPHLYITLTGFYDAHLPIELTQIRVPINSIVKISGERILAEESDVNETDHKTTSEDSEPSPRASSKHPDKSPKARGSSRKSSMLVSKGKKGKSLISSRPDEAEIRNFWDIMKNNFNAPDTPLLINNIAFLTLPQQKEGYLVEKEMYDQVCNVLFDTHDLTWLHDRYLSAMLIREIPNERLKVGTEVLDELMISLPPGRMTVGFFLNAMVAQVCHTETMLMSGMHSKDKLRGKNKRRKSEEKTLSKRSVDSIVNEERRAFFHSFDPDFNLPEATVNMLKNSRVPTLMKLFKPIDDIANKIHMFRLWEHSDRDLVTFDSIRNFLQMLRINTIECTKPLKYERNTGCSKFKSVIVNDLFDMTTYYRNFPYKIWVPINKRDPNLKFQELLIECFLNPDLVDFKNLLHGLIEEKRLTKNMYFYEDKPVGANLLCLHEAYNKFNCMDYIYIDVLDTVLIQFHNKHDKRGIFNDYWMGTITTPVGLRDFCSFILTETRRWVQHEQDSLKEQREKKLEELEKIRNEQIHSIEVTLDNETFQENMNTPIPRNSEEVCRRDESYCSSLRASYQELPKNYGKLSYLGVEKIEKKLFEGYNLGSLRIQVNGHTSTFYSTMSSQVRVETRKWLYGGDKVLGIEVVKSGHTLILNKTTDSTGTQSSVSFHVIFASNIILTLKERNTEILPLPSPVQRKSTDQISKISPETTEEHKPVQETARKSKRGRKVVDKVEEEPEVPEISVPDNECGDTPPKNIYDMKLSWPTGLLMETVPFPNGEYPMYVRQRYVSSAVPKAVSDEKYRCALSNGNVLLFKKNGNIIIMSPNGTIFTCKRYRYQEPIRPPSPPPPPPPTLATEKSDQFEASEDKEMSKKGKRDSKKGKKSIDKEEETPAKKGKKGETSVDKEEETPGKKDKKGRKSIKKEDEDEEDSKEEKQEEEIQREKELKIPCPDDEEEPPTERKRSVRLSLSADNQETEPSTLPDLPVSEPPDLPNLPASSEAKFELPEFCPFNVLEYDVLTPMGEYYTVKDGAISKVHEYLPLRIDTDKKSGEVYILRADGTKTFFKKNGILLVTFPDRTRIATRMILDLEENAEKNIETKGKSEEGEGDKNRENEKAEDDAKKANEEGEMGANEDGRNNEKEANGKYVGKETNQEYVQENDEQERTQEILSDNSPTDSETEESIIKSFELVHLGALVEHPNYASISFNNQSNITKMVMPMNVEMCMNHSEGEICIKLDKDTFIDQRERTLKFRRGSVNETCINLDDHSLENPLCLFCETTDVRGDRFIIFSSGETSYIPNGDKHQRNKVTSRRNTKRYFALSRDLSGREFFPRYVHGGYLRNILEGGGRVEFTSPETDNLIHLHKISKPIWDSPTEKWTAKYVRQQERPKRLNIGTLSALHYNPYVWLQYRNRPRLNFYCENLRPPRALRVKKKKRRGFDNPWQATVRMFYDVSKEFAETIMEGLKKYCDEGVASVDEFMGYETWLEPWQQEIVAEALKTGKVPVMKVFAHFNNVVNLKVMKALDEIVQKFIVLERCAREKGIRAGLN